ncbi:signal transduction histidine kinase [Symbiobacterium terraclitae]|uniref:Oxygen sensor histidine kinase NreB n=1 Tax=Symbiobacterium terraclitae TaxID=557451 RepID=A0ABS4JRL1_9FIRM|nr:signal transduction histidine kinase [Symbiobacterium terraclitae]
MPVVEALVLPLIAIGVGFHLAVSWALLWRYYQTRERSLLTWGVGWLVLTLHVLGMFLTEVGVQGASLLRDIALAAAALGFLGGQVERSGQSPAAMRPLVLGGILLLGAAFVLGVAAGDPVGVTAAGVVAIALGGAAWLAFPAQAEDRRSLSQWLLFTGFCFGALRALGTAWPGRALAPDVAGQALFSLFFSAAVTWQSWEHERAVRLFSRTLERLNRPLNLQEALDESLRLVAETLKVKEGWILLRTEGRGGAEGEWTIGAAYGFPEWARVGVHAQHFPIDRCLCLRHLSGSALVTQVRDLACVRATAEVGHPSGRHITIPLGQDGRVAGIMVLMVHPSRYLSAADRELLTALGEQIGLAIDRARLYDQLAEKERMRSRLLARLITAQEDERRRIARELHDETGQALTALVVTLDFLARHPMDAEALRKRLSNVKEMAEASLAEVRRVIHEMRPTALDDLGLEAAIRWLVRRYEHAGLKIGIEIDGLNGRLPDHIEITVFRLIQEACTNTVKHAGARNVSIRLRQKGGWLTVEVTDDGMGFDPLRRGEGVGLAGIRERVTLAGGELRIESGPQTGTRVYAELPVEGAMQSGDTGADLRRPHDGASGRTHGAAV